MRKIFFVISNYKDGRQHMFLNHFSPRNKEYAEKHGFEYIVYGPGGTHPMPHSPRKVVWLRLSLIRDMINNGELKDGDIATHMDADMCIVRGGVPFEPAPDKSFAYAIDNGNTHCFALFSMRINDWSKKLLDNLLDDEFYQAHIDRPHWQTFQEMASWYTLTGIPTHSWTPFFDLPNYGFHVDKTDNTSPKYSVEELLKHVHIFEPDWNGTLFESECNDGVTASLMQYNICKSDINNMRIRHFAGGQPWTTKFAEKPIRWD